MLQVQSPYQQLFDSSGAPLENGSIYVGTVNLNPETNPISVYWDDQGTQPAAQPLKTSGGYIVRNGTPARVYISQADYSMTVRDKKGQIVFSEMDVTSLSTLQQSLAASSGSSLIGFIQSGTGAIATTVQAVLRESVSVTQFVTLQQAIDTGKDVYIPAGVSITSTPVTITTQGQKIYGSGASSIISPSAAGAHLFQVQAAYVTICDLRLNGVDSSSANTNFAVFTATATPASYLTVERVVFSGANSGVGFTNAVKFDDGCHYGTVSECSIERLWGNTSGHGYGVLAGNVIGCRVLNNRMVATSGRGRHGVYFSAGCSDSVANGNYLTGFDYEGISQYSQGAQGTCARNVYSNNTLTGCSASTNIYSGSIGIYQHSYGCVVANNTITASGQKGIAIDGSGATDLANTLVIGNTVSYSGTTGIDLTATTRCAVIGNVVFESGTKLAGAYANIMLRTATIACVDTLISGNMCGGNTYARSSLSIDLGPPAPSLLFLTGNDFRPGTSYTIETNAVAGVQVDGRLQFRFDSVGYGPIANGASYVGPLALPGASQGDIITVTHTQNHDGCVMYVYANADNTGVLTIANLSGGAKTIPAGTLRVDVWKRPTGFQ
jgi:parallel beta-helix repeat protein